MKREGEEDLKRARLCSNVIPWMSYLARQIGSRLPSLSLARHTRAGGGCVVLASTSATVLGTKCDSLEMSASHLCVSILPPVVADRLDLVTACRTMCWLCEDPIDRV